MGTWGYGSGDGDGPHEWYPFELDKNDKRVVPTGKQVNQALKDWLSKKPYGEYPFQEFLGIVILALADQVLVSKSHLKRALKEAQSLHDSEDYLKSYASDGSKRKQVLKKEIVQMTKAFGGEIPSSKVKLKTGLFEVLNRPIKKKKTAKTAKKEMRPSPMQSATLFKPGTKKKGSNGKLWVVQLTKNRIHRWVQK